MPTRDFWVTLTTTDERAVFDGVGVVFVLVGELRGPGPIGERLGHEEIQGYQSRFAFLSPRGLWLSLPNPEPTADRLDLADVPALFDGTSPTWPLPDETGCSHESGDFVLPIGRVRGLKTTCLASPTDYGLATVTTIWVDRVGFAFREITPTGPTASGEMYRDYLVGGDLIELAPPALGADVTVLLPPE